MKIVEFKTRAAVIFLTTTALALFLCFYFDMNVGVAAINSPESVNVDWKDEDFLTEKPLPIIIRPSDVVEGVSIQKLTVDIQGKTVFYALARPAKGSTPTGKVLFLLHGAAFTSKTWHEEVATIQTMSSIGHTVIAIDLPGYGQSTGNSGDKGEFLEEVIKQLSPDKRPVLVSPSMSGSFSLALLNRNPDAICGYVPVAPVATSLYADPFFSSLHVPTLIIYGENDTGLGVTSAKQLSKIPTSTKPQVLSQARHPAYLDQPDRWHLLLYNFMHKLDC